jgi:hypothetical protein
MNKPRPVLRLYTRVNCHLCDEMKQSLRGLESELEFKLEVHDVDAQEGTKKLYGNLVPVLMWGRDVICYHQLDRAVLARALGK